MDKKKLTRECHVDDSAQIRYDIVSSRYTLIDLRFFKSDIEGVEGNDKRCTAPMFDMVTHEFKI